MPFGQVSISVGAVEKIGVGALRQHNGGSGQAH